MKDKKAQSMLELALLLFCIAAALIVMAVYIKRGVQGKLRDIGDEISQSQYSPGDTQGHYLTTLNQTKTVEITKEPVTEERFGQFVYRGQMLKRTEKTQNETTIVQGGETVR